jgi:hypothetical protein
VITDPTTLRALTAHAFLHPLKSPAHLLVLHNGDTHLINKVNQQMPAHLSNPMLRVLLVALTYIALAATFFGIFLLREAASTEVSDFLKVVKTDDEKQMSLKKARLDSALAKIEKRNAPPQEVVSPHEQHNDLLSSQTTNDAETVLDDTFNQAINVPLPTTVQIPEDEDSDWTSPFENFPLDDDDDWTSPFENFPLDDDDWTSPFEDSSSDDDFNSIYTNVSTTDDELQMSYSDSDDDPSDDDAPRMKS